MYRLYIVDDEPYVIDGLKKCISWDKHGISIIGSATDGLTAYNEIIENPPDLVIIDIKMPAMDGITVINKVHEVFPNISFIIFSGYDDFHYAKQAILAQAADYLIKPSSTEEILSAVSRALSSHQRSVQTIEHSGKDYRRIIKNIFTNPTDQIYDTGYYYVAIMETSDLSTIRKQEKEFVFSINTHDVYCTFMELLDRQLIIIYSEQKISQILWEKIIERIHKNLEVFLTDEKDMLRIGIGSPVKLHNIKTGYHEALGALEYCQWLSLPFACFESVEYNDVETAGLPFWNYLNALIKTEDYADIYRLISDQFETFRAQKISQKSLSAFCFRALMCIDDSALSTYNINPILEINNLHSVSASCTYLNNTFRIHFENRPLKNSGSNQSRFVQDIVDFIHAHYQEPISLCDVADYMHKSTGYVSSRFKKEFGCGFSQYVNDYRLLKSRQLLIIENMKIKEISSMVGFSDEQYFSSVFKKEFGITPGNYRKIYQTR